MRHLTDSVGTTPDHRPLEGLHIVVDCANGAASLFAPEVLTEPGATVTALFHTSPDGGLNINERCGSTHPVLLLAFGGVTERGADLGLALDGDADRVIAVDHTGTIVDGDVLLGFLVSRSTWRSGASWPATPWWSRL